VSATERVERTDVVILGGGLAGLSLAIQLRRAIPQIRVLVLERRQHPVPESAHKVGESTVEIGADYFHTVLGLKQHLMDQQLKKYGFRFFFCDGERAFDRTLELGASTYLATPGFQIDRGIFENFLSKHACELGVRFLDGATVKSVELEDDSRRTAHRVRYEHAACEHTAESRWVIDASGRAGLLKRKLQLQQSNGHEVSAVWFRIRSRIDVNEWSRDETWLGRCDPPWRWLSTNHLCGTGYWTWLIPLSSGSHSVGVVWETSQFPFEAMTSFEKLMQWLHEHQPVLAADVESKTHLLQDFCYLRNFSYGCKQVFSGHRWGLTGEAGVFLDPFYSPGSDFIAIANTYLTDLIERDLRGELIAGRANVYQRMFFSFCESTLSLYRGQYSLFGDPEVLPVKVIWDYAFYWGVLCQLFFQRRLTDLTNISLLGSELQRSKELNEILQVFMREWSQRSAKRNAPVLLDQAALAWFAELNRGLRDELTEEQFRERIKQNVRLLESLAMQIASHALALVPDLDISPITKLIGEASVSREPLLFSNAA
jgi:flavin-dependent dehydrogenase